MFPKLSTEKSEGDVSCSIISDGGRHFAVGRKAGFTIYRVVEKRGDAQHLDYDRVKGLESPVPLAELHIVYHVPLHSIRCCPSKYRFRYIREYDGYEEISTLPPPSSNDIEIKSLADVCDGITHLALYGEYPRLAIVARPRQVSDGLRRRWQGGGYDCMPSATNVLILRCTDATSALITNEVTVENDVVSIFLSTNILGVCTSVGWNLFAYPMEASTITQLHQEKFDSAHPSTPQHPPPFVFCAKFGLLLTRSPRSVCGIALYGFKRQHSRGVWAYGECDGTTPTVRFVKYAEDVCALRHCVENATLHVGPQIPHQSGTGGIFSGNLVIRVAVSSVKRRVLHVFHLEPGVTRDILLQKLGERCAVSQDCVVPFTRLLKQYVCSSYMSNPPRLDQLQFVECGSCIAWFDTQRRHVNFLHGVPTSAPQKMLWASVFGMKSQVGLLRMGGPFFGKERLPADAPLFLFAADCGQRQFRQMDFFGYPNLSTAACLETHESNVLEPLPPPSVVYLNCINCQNGDLLTIREYPHRGEMYASSVNHRRVSCRSNIEVSDEYLGV